MIPLILIQIHTTMIFQAFTSADCLATLNAQQGDLPSTLSDLSDSELEEILLEYASISQPPYLLAGIGLAISIVCGLTFSRLVQDSLKKWREDRLPIRPFGKISTTMSFSGILLGITLFMGASLQIFGFGAGVAIFVALLLSLLTGTGLWAQLEGLIKQVESGNFKAVDFDNFDEFF